MADEEKTEEPTSKKIEDARKKGNVPKSQETSSFITLLLGLAILFTTLSYSYDKIRSIYRYYQSLIGMEMTKNSILNMFLVSSKETLLLILPLAVSIAIAGVLAGVIQFGFLFTTHSITPDLKKLDPIKGLKNLLSLKKLIETIKTVLKVAAVFGVAFYFLLAFTEELPYTVFLNIPNQLSWLLEKMLILTAVMLALFLVLSLIDLLIVRYQYFKDLRMSKQEVKDEYKQMEGDPQVKSRIKRVQMEMSRKRMMQEVPDADVIITNPTHYAVAIRYDRLKDRAPVVLAKGTDMLALKIKEIGRNHQIQIVENPPLARELYKACDLKQMIPENLYKAVAEILAFVYNSNKKESNK